MKIVSKVEAGQSSKGEECVELKSLIRTLPKKPKFRSNVTYGVNNVIGHTVSNGNN